ncbi:YgcG family protein [Aerosakkonema sp. BLCC-F183]|uniref:TPM domain-containing protein n=1 Tax=Aerosakkonema sp. BLCC-F183 TaxID=3342834 RepID=UPI0035BA15C4
MREVNQLNRSNFATPEAKAVKFVALAIHQTLCVGFLSLAIASFPIPSKAITVQEVPGPRPNGWVTDTIDILSPATEAEINRSISQLEAQNSCEIMVITVPETSPYTSPREFALAWFKYWTIGKKGLDNGVLLLYSKGDDRIEIVTGWGIIEIFPDDRVVSLIKTEIRPRVNQGNFNGAMLTGTQEIIKVLQTYKPHPSPHTNNLVSTIGQQYNSPFNRPAYVWILTGCSAVVAIFAGLGITRSRLPAFIKLSSEPQPLRILGSDEHDKEIITSLYLCSFSSVFAITFLFFGNFFVGIIAALLSYNGLTYLLVKALHKDKKRQSIRPLHCADCQQPLKQLNSTSLSKHLSPPQQAAQKLGHIKFEGWRCPKCHPGQTSGRVHLRAYVTTSDSEKLCPTCQELTVSKSISLVEEPTYVREGKRLITYKCHSCSYHKHIQQIIPILSSSDSGGSDGGSGGGDGGGGGGG